MSEYVLQVGKKGFDRLKFINDVFGEHSRNFLIRAGLREGSRILEIGCGTGSMTTWLAKTVGKNGRVIAVDASEEPHTSSLITTPRNEYIERLNKMFVELGILQGFDFNIGDKLLTMMKLAGYSGLHACFVQPVILMAEAIEFVMMGAAEVAPFAVKCGMVSEIETKKMLHELANSEFDEDSYYTFPRQAQIFGYKQ